MKLSDVIGTIGGCNLISDGEFEILEQCTRIRSPLALTYLEDIKYAAYLKNENISCLICTPDLQEFVSNISGIAVSNAPKTAFFKLHNFLASQDKWFPTTIDPSARISPSAWISPYNVKIGKNVEIQPFAIINANTTIQDDVRICNGTVIAGQSFTAVPDGEKRAFLVRDRGKVLIEEGAEICSVCHIACGTLENDITIIGAYSKLDAMVHVGHGTVIGRQTFIPAGVMISGNCVIGNNVWIGVNATISNRITIGNYGRVSLGSVVTKDVPSGATVSGNFAIDHQRFLQNLKYSIQKISPLERGGQE